MRRLSKQSTYRATWRHEFNFWSPSKAGRREPALQSYPLTSTHMLSMSTPTPPPIIINKNIGNGMVEVSRGGRVLQTHWPTGDFLWYTGVSHQKVPQNTMQEIPNGLPDLNRQMEKLWYTNECHSALKWEWAPVTYANTGEHWGMTSSHAEWNPSIMERQLYLIQLLSSIRKDSLQWHRVRWFLTVSAKDVWGLTSQFQESKKKKFSPGTVLTGWPNLSLPKKRASDREV